MVGPVSLDHEMLNFEGVSKYTISDYERGLGKLQILEGKITKIQAMPAIALSDYLEEALVPEEIEQPLVRKYVVLTYNTLKRSGSLDILLLPESDLYVHEHDGTGTTHEKIRELARAFFHEVSRYDSDQGLNFGLVIACLKVLHTPGKAGNWNNLSLFWLKAFKRKFENAIEFYKQKIISEHDYYVALQGLATKTANDFPRGDFTFVYNPIITSLLQHAFQLIEKADLWSHFDKVVKENDAFRECAADDDLRTKVIDVLQSKEQEYAPTLYAMSAIINRMVEVRKKGWEKFVEDQLENTKKTLESYKA